MQEHQEQGNGPHSYSLTLPSRCLLGLLLLVGGFGGWRGGLLLALLALLLLLRGGFRGSGSSGFLDRGRSLLVICLASLVGFRRRRGFDRLGLTVGRGRLTSVRIRINLISNGSQSNLGVRLCNLFRLRIFRNRLSSFVGCSLNTVDGEVLLVRGVPDLSMLVGGERVGREDQLVYHPLA